jgi:hypothetical protein
MLWRATVSAGDAMRANVVDPMASDWAGDGSGGRAMSILADFSPKCRGCGMKCSGCVTKCTGCQIYKVYGLRHKV